MNKYRLTDETMEYCGRTLHRIEALRAFADVKEGEKGGWIEREENLSHSGDAWVGGNAKVFNNARVYGNALVSGDAWVGGDAMVCGDAEVYGNAAVYGEAKVGGDAEVKSNSDYIVFKNFWSSGRYFTWTRSNNMWRVGCFYGTGEELIAAYKDSELSGREYERVVKYVQSVLDDENNKQQK